MKNNLSNYYKDLPQGFKEDYCIDAKKPKVIVLLNVFSLLLMVVAGVATYLLRFGTQPLYEEEVGGALVVIALGIIILGYFAYLVVHELTHGICYKLLTKQKLTFGLTLYVAFCGLKEGFVNKKTAIIAVLAPFVVHSIWMLLAIFLVREPLISLAFIVLFALHFGGCIGDLWVTFVLVFKYRSRAVLMNDNGPRQIFYIYSDEPSEAVADAPEAEDQSADNPADKSAAQPAEDNPAENPDEQSTTPTDQPDQSTSD